MNRRAAKGTVSGRPLAVVTGATVGIGYELSRLLARSWQLLQAGGFSAAGLW